MGHYKICNKCKGSIFYIYDDKINEKGICEDCGGTYELLKFPWEDWIVLKNISKEDDFLNAMLDLKENAIIEYQSKMSQFRNQVQQQERAKQSKVLRCPTCSSTNVQKIDGLERGISVAAWGMFSKKINKSFKCKSCGYTW